MKTRLYMIIFAAFSIVACTNDEDEICPVIEDNNSAHSEVLLLDGGIQRFNDDATTKSAAATRVATSEWDDGATLYIQYHTAGGNVQGMATYSETADEWTVNYYGSITRNETTSCEVYYFENPISVTEETVELDYTSAVFADKEATYLYKDGVVHLKTHLMPQTGRIRFRGEPGCQFSFTGLKWFAKFNIGLNTLYDQNDLLNLIINDDGYSTYVYAMFEDATSHEMRMDQRSFDKGFIRNFENTVLSVGTSGYVNVPSPNSRNGWRNTYKLLPPCPDDNHPHQIDMGNGIMWACCNVGAKSPIEYGDYFSWGGVATKRKYDTNNLEWYLDFEDKLYKYVTDSKYGTRDNKTQLESSDDAAHVKWGGSWRTPTKKELVIIVSNATWTWTIINGINGYKVTAQNGNSIFFPAGGYYAIYDNQYAGSIGAYWSSSLSDYSDWNAWTLSFDNSHIHTYIPGSVINQLPRFRGQNVRPVTE